MKSLLLFLSCLSLAPASPVDRSRPNLIFILSDDLGWNEPAFNGGDPGLTPHLAKLREQSLSLTRFYVHAVCAPTRAAFLTGRYPFRTWSDWRSEDFGKPSYLAKLGMELVGNDAGEETRRIHGLAGAERTIAEMLGEDGYFTSLVG